MALKANLTVDVPFVGSMQLPAIIRVCNVTATPATMNVTVQAFHDGGSGELIRTDTHLIAPDLECQDNFIRQAYLHLKSLPEFASATDC